LQSCRLPYLFSGRQNGGLIIGHSHVVVKITNATHADTTPVALPTTRLPVFQISDFNTSNQNGGKSIQVVVETGLGIPECFITVTTPDITLDTFYSFGDDGLLAYPWAGHVVFIGFQLANG
jgi:hypothetical protein